LKPDTWDRLAATYDDPDECQDYRRQVQSVLDILQQKGALDKKNIVMDIACGTGTYAVKMAARCKEVVCLDVSKGMLERLTKKARGLGISNIRIIHSDWHDFETSERFDLVFVSMTPLVRSSENIKRFLELSRRFVAIVTWAGIRKNPLLEELYQEIMGRELRHKGQDMIFPCNYLYSLGYAPYLTFFNGCWERIRPVEQQAENMIWRLELYRRLTDSEKRLVYSRIKALCGQDGLVSITTRVRTCLMLVDKEEPEFSC